MPLPTMASAMPLIMSSLTLQPNLFQLFQPIGGVRASPLSQARASGTLVATSPSSRQQAACFSTLNIGITSRFSQEKSTELFCWSAAILFEARRQVPQLYGWQRVESAEAGLQYCICSMGNRRRL